LHDATDASHIDSPPQADIGATPPRPRKFQGLALPLLLFTLTLITTLFAGANYTLTSHLPENRVSILSVDDRDVDLINVDLWRQVLRRPSLLGYGGSFALPLLLILGAHEMGHYLACRRHGIRATLPHFIPAPTMIGTFGAFIRIRGPIPSRRALFDVGIAGPLAGFLVTIPVLVYGIQRSTPEVFRPAPGFWHIFLGEPLVFSGLVRALHGPLAPGVILDYHPAAFAGWFGLLLTAFNLFPISQLDGGHLGYALFGRPYAAASRAVFIIILLLGFVYNGWLIWALIVFLLGFQHPPTLNDSLKPGLPRVLFGLLALLVFALCFTARPIYFVTTY
jgi:membrane-associated protease RseP (regulator of RpoE activity)